MKVGLTMMVKNEAKIITRALNSALPLVDYVLVVDTGSSDGTQNLVREWIAKTQLAFNNFLGGELIEEPWQDFGYNRTFCLSALRKNTAIDYALMLDADEVLELENAAEGEILKNELKTDAYSIPIHRGSLVYPLPRLTRNSMPFFYTAPAHEYLECATKHSKADLAGIKIKAHWDGARLSDPGRYAREAEGFEKALKTETDPFKRQRFTFYLAQSYRDSDQATSAYVSYMARADLGGWIEEVYVALVNAARLAEKLNHRLDEILAIYRRAIALLPMRAEARHGAARLCRNHLLYHEGYAFAKPGLVLSGYNGLFVEKWLYDYGLMDEFAISAFYVNEFVESWLACLHLLKLPGLDPKTRKRIADNAQLARDQI